MQGSSWLTQHQSLLSAAYMTPESARGGLMCAPHILIMNSGTIWASHSGLVRQELQGSPIHDQLIGKPVLSQGPIFMWCLSTEEHSLLHFFRKKQTLPRLPAERKCAKWQSDTSVEEENIVDIFSTLHSKRKQVSSRADHKAITYYKIMMLCMRTQPRTGETNQYITMLANRW